ncbi:MAG: hypothetical protein LBR42_03190 [Candidatus Methanoplasma sp.]|jgi:hypothetical protein|nr:hypothetical protein [Candidatus Methanoplasma sp.]
MPSKRKTVQIVAVAFLLLSGLLLFPNTSWSDSTSVVGYISLLFGIAGSICSVFIPTTYVQDFTEKDWTLRKGTSLKSDSYDSFFLKIDVKKHKMGKTPTGTVYFLTEDGRYVDGGMYSFYHDECGNIEIKANHNFPGKVIVRVS